MLYPTTPFGGKAAMFKEAAAIGASTIRLDIFLSAVFSSPFGEPDWTGVDQYMLLAHRYHLRVLADLLATPSYVANCPSGTPPELTYRCPASDPARWGQEAGLVAAHTRGVIDYFEIINEPDGGWAFYGTPQQYAQILAASSAAIHAADPGARVALGGLMNIDSQGWIDAVLAALGKNAESVIDIANIHVRTAPSLAGDAVMSWRRYFARHGFTGPLWVTESGYPADPQQQADPAYRRGSKAQARYLAATVPTMLCAGAAKVFITERDALTGPYATEGFLKSSDPLTARPAYTRRPSFYTMRALAARIRRWGSASAAGECPRARR